MSKGKFRKARKANMEARIREIWARWLLSHTRPERLSKRDLLILARELLGKGPLSIEQLIDAHRHRSALALKVAIAEVEEFSPQVAQKLRDLGLLVYPVTEVGFKATTPPKPVEVSYHVPGMGRGQSTYGWRVASTPNDPVFIGYWNMRLGQSAGGIQKIVTAVDQAVVAGVIAKPLPPVTLPKEVNP